ncbi:hypothetical protein ACFX13_028587 [Malus domestica]
MFHSKSANKAKRNKAQELNPQEIKHQHQQKKDKSKRPVQCKEKTQRENNNNNISRFWPWLPGDWGGRPGKEQRPRRLEVFEPCLSGNILHSAAWFAPLGTQDY